MLPNSRSGNAADPRVKRTRKLIEQAFEGLLGEKGFQALTVQDIADRATLNRATFYAHFEDKYALLDSYIRESFQQCLTATVLPSAAFSAASVGRLAVAVFGYVDPLQGRPALQELREAGPGAVGCDGDARGAVPLPARLAPVSHAARPWSGQDEDARDHGYGHELGDFWGRAPVGARGPEPTDGGSRRTGRGCPGGRAFGRPYRRPCGPGGPKT